MATVSVHGLDDDVVQRLRERAAANNRSLEAEVRSILERLPPETTERLTGQRRRRSSSARNSCAPLSAGRKHTPSEQMIREDRDSDHGRLWPLD